MGIKSGEIGKIININASFDLTSNTDLKLSFLKPDLSTLEKDKAGGVSAPGVDFTDPITGDVFNAGEYFSYTVISGDIDQTGVWRVHGTYIDATPKNFCGDTVSFDVGSC